MTRLPKVSSSTPAEQPKELQEVQKLAREASPGIVKTLATIAEGEKNPATARVAATNAILDRAFGKAPPAESSASIVIGSIMVTFVDPDHDR